jgi:hypothetical protein
MMFKNDFVVCLASMYDSLRYRNPSETMWFNFRCQIESSDALAEHVRGRKHVESVNSFDPFASTEPGERQKRLERHRKKNPDVPVPLDEKLAGHKFPLVGLESVQEFRCPNQSTLPRMYKCCLFACNGSWGSSHQFAKHLMSKKHLQSFFLDKNPSVILKDRENQDEDIIDCGQQLSMECLVKEAQRVVSAKDRDFSVMEIIEDEERYWIQANRDPNVQQVRLSFYLHTLVTLFILDHSLFGLIDPLLDITVIIGSFA